MIFVTSDSLTKGIEFTRLSKKMDEIAGNMNERVRMQIGVVDYESKNATSFRDASSQEDVIYFEKPSLVIGHYGIERILNTLRRIRIIDSSAERR